MSTHGMIFEQPQLFPNCHASTIAHLGGGRLMAAWFGGSREKHADVGIWFAVGQVGQWDPPRLLVKIGPVAHWNPVLFAAPDGRVHLFFKVGATIHGWRSFTMSSPDGGQTWTYPVEFCAQDRIARGPVKNKPIVLSDGAWLAPASHEWSLGDRKFWDAFTDRSDDGGRTWLASPFVPIDHDTFPGVGVIQPTLWESSPGNVHMLLRTKNGKVARSDSTNGGRSWSPATLLEMDHNNSGLDLTRLADGTLVLVHNPVVGKVRTPLSISVSTDNGLSWRRALDLETQPGEYSYPGIIAMDHQTVAICYTWQRTAVAYWVGTGAELAGS